MTTQLTLAPVIDGDGLQYFHLTSNQSLVEDPTRIAIIVKSSDVAVVLNANQVGVDIAELFLSETP
jgi:hypothetical protein